MSRIYPIRGHVPLVNTSRKSKRLRGKKSSSKPVIFNQRQIAALNQE